MNDAHRIEVLKKVIPSGPSKKELSLLAILEGAITCFAKHGFENTTFADIATQAGVSKPLVIHYFKQKEALIEACIEYVIQTAQSFVGQGIGAEQGAKEKLLRYVDVNFEWAKQYPSHVKLWGYFLYRCSFDKKWREINIKVKRAAQDRIQGVIRQGVSEDVFENSNVESDAALIQLSVYSAILALGTEQSVTLAAEQVSESLKRFCLKALGAT